MEEQLGMEVAAARSGGWFGLRGDESVEAGSLCLGFQEWKREVNLSIYWNLLGFG